MCVRVRTGKVFQMSNIDLSGARPPYVVLQVSVAGRFQGLRTSTQSSTSQNIWSTGSWHGQDLV